MKDIQMAASNRMWKTVDSLKILAVCALFIFASAGYAGGGGPEGILFSIGPTNASYGEPGEVYDPQGAGLMLRFGLWGSLDHSSKSLFGISLNFSPARIKANKDFVLDEDSIKAGQIFYATHLVAAVDWATEPVFLSFRGTISVGAGIFAFSSPLWGTNASNINSRLIPELTLGGGVSGSQAINNHIRLQLHPYFMLSYQANGKYHGALQSVSAQLGALLTVMVK